MTARTRNRYSSMMAARVAALSAAAALAGIPVHAQGAADQTPRELQGVDVTENLGVELPLNMEFVDSTGERVALGDYFKGDLPVILTFNYYNCPMLCTLQLNGLVKALKKVDFDPDEDYRIVTVSIEPDETPTLATDKKTIYVKSLGREGGAAGWHFLVSPDNKVATLADLVGFGYKWNEDQGEWAHPAAAMFVSPNGKVTRYLYGIEPKPDDVRLALLEASEGKLGSTVDRFILWCFHYDDKSGQYTPHVMNIVRLCGGLTVLVLGSAIFVMWRRDQRKKWSSNDDHGGATYPASVTS